MDKVEDVIDLGDELTVRVDDIDPQGKVSLSLVDDDRAPSGNGSDRATTTAGPGDESPGSADEASFEDVWEQEAKASFGDLGPAESSSGGSRPERGPRRNPRRRH